MSSRSNTQKYEQRTVAWTVHFDDQNGWATLDRIVNSWLARGWTRDHQETTPLDDGRVLIQTVLMRPIRPHPPNIVQFDINSKPKSS